MGGTVISTLSETNERGYGKALASQELRREGGAKERATLETVGPPARYGGKSVGEVRGKFARTSEGFRC